MLTPSSKHRIPKKSRRLATRLPLFLASLAIVLSLPPLLPRPFLLAALGASMMKLLPRRLMAIVMTILLFLLTILVKMFCHPMILSKVRFAVKILRPLWSTAIRMFLPSCFPLRLVLFALKVPSLWTRLLWVIFWLLMCLQSCELVRIIRAGGSSLFRRIGCQGSALVGCRLMREMLKRLSAPSSDAETILDN
jgi:hypothetical protein